MDKSAVTLERMRIFVRIAERGNLSAVAREMGLGQSTVTRQLALLEQAVGVPLIARTTRTIALTGEGARYYDECLQILRLIDQAGEEARTARDAPAGTVRLSCPAAFGVLRICPLIFAFQDRYPDIRVDLDLTDQRVDLIAEGFDLAVRLGPLTESSLRLKPLGISHRVMVASPAYLARHGRPDRPSDLTRHEGLRMSNVAGSDRLLFDGPDGRGEAVPFSGRLLVDHGLALREAFIAGRGIGPAHRWLIQDLLEDGRLEVVMADYRLTPVPLNLLLAPERAAISRVRLLADFLAGSTQGIPGVSRP
ncbi:MAG: LysR family transcriptional regulator [Telmatospirillum sp.]|nr:LysR family transcriptional regulator [Telmatospirillum sp.]